MRVAEPVPAKHLAGAPEMLTIAKYAVVGYTSLQALLKGGFLHRLPTVSGR